MTSKYSTRTTNVKAFIAFILRIFQCGEIMTMGQLIWPNPAHQVYI